MCEIFSLEQCGHSVSSSRSLTKVTKGVLPGITYIHMTNIHDMDPKFSQVTSGCGISHEKYKIYRTSAIQNYYKNYIESIKQSRY
jgi:hypothetical protein